MTGRRSGTRPRGAVALAAAALLVLTACSGTATDTGPTNTEASGTVPDSGTSGTGSQSGIGGSGASQPSSPGPTGSKPAGSESGTAASSPPSTQRPPSSAAPPDTGRSPTGQSSAEPTGQSGIPTVRVTGTIATGLTTPWGLDFLPDGTALVTERDTGAVLAIDPDSGHAVRTVGTVQGVQPGGEGGLLGLAVDPAAGSTPRVLVYYTAADDNRVAALTLDADATRITDQHDILTGIPKATVHNGGRIVIGPDGDLYIGTGDATDSAAAQRLDYLGGKILRITTDGDPAPGNPFPNAPLVYSYGHRNVQGLAFDAQGQLWASEFGASAYDELNRIRPGGNYGWPEVEGPSDNPDFVAPYKYWPTSEASPSGLAIVGRTALMAALRGERLWLIPLAGPAGATEPVATLTGEYGRLRTVLAAPDGSVWLTTSNTDGRGDVQPGDDRILQLSVH